MNYNEMIERKLKSKKIIPNKEEASQEIKEEKELNETISNKDKFSFGGLIDELSDLVYKTSEASYNQIQVKILQNLAFLFSYGGFNKIVNNGFYVYDLSPSGMGKSDAVKKLRKLLLYPAIKEVEVKHKEERQRAKEEKRESKIHKILSGNAISPEALFKLFETEPVQMVEIAELGKALKRDYPIIDKAIELYGHSEIYSQTYKNNFESDKHIIENITFFLYGDTNLEYLGIKGFYEHLKGGLLNRGLIAFNKIPRAFEELPATYELEEHKIKQYNLIAKDIIDFSRKYSNTPINPSFTNNSLYIAFKRDIYELKTELQDIKNPFVNLYVRVMQNFNSVLYTLHFLNCYTKGYFDNKISDITIEQTAEYFKVFLSNYDNLIEEVLTYYESEDEELKRKIINKVRELLQEKNECTLREVYKSLKIPQKKAEVIIKEYIQVNGEFKLSTQKNTAGRKSKIITLVYPFTG